jgi:hypothetical protein
MIKWERTYYAFRIFVIGFWEFVWDLGFGIWDFASRDLVLGISSVAG